MLTKLLQISTTSPSSMVITCRCVSPTTRAAGSLTARSTSAPTAPLHSRAHTIAPASPLAASLLASSTRTHQTALLAARAPTTRLPRAPPRAFHTTPTSRTPVPTRKYNAVWFPLMARILTQSITATPMLTTRPPRALSSLATPVSRLTTLSPSALKMIHDPIVNDTSRSRCSRRNFLLSGPCFVG
jgi:hypothetical protein